MKLWKLNPAVCGSAPRTVIGIKCSRKSNSFLFCWVVPEEIRMFYSTKTSVKNQLIPLLGIYLIKVKTYTEKNSKLRISLVVQWLKVCLPVQGTWVWSLIRKLRSHMSQGSWAHAPQLERSPRATTKDPKCHNSDLTKSKIKINIF